MTGRPVARRYIDEPAPKDRLTLTLDIPTDLLTDLLTARSLMSLADTIARLAAAIAAEQSAELAALDQASARATDAETERDKALADLSAAETQLADLIAVVQGATPAPVLDGQAPLDAPPTV